MRRLSCCRRVYCAWYSDRTGCRFGGFDAPFGRPGAAANLSDSFGGEG